MVPFHMDFFFFFQFRLFLCLLSSLNVFFFFFFVGSFVWKSKCQDRAVQKERHFLCLVHALPAQRTENQPAIMLATKKKKLKKIIEENSSDTLRRLASTRKWCKFSRIWCKQFLESSRMHGSWCRFRPTVARTLFRECVRQSNQFDLSSVLWGFLPLGVIIFHGELNWKATAD